MTTSLLYIHPSDWTDADLVRHLWHFRLIQPEWVGSLPEYDYLRWTQAETLARLAVVLSVWVGSAGWILRRHLSRRTVSPPNQAVTLDGSWPVQLTFPAQRPAASEPEGSATLYA